MQIRLAQVSDAAAIAALHSQNWQQVYCDVLHADYLREHVPAERLAVWHERLADPAHNQRIWLAEQSGELCGFACAYAAQDAQWGTYIDNLHVAAKKRGRGLGLKLLAEVARWHTSIGYIDQGLYLWVVDGNTLAQQFYQRCAGQAKDRDVWQAPDGSAVPSIRMAWKDARVLMQKTFASIA